MRTITDSVLDQCPSWEFSHKEIPHFPPPPNISIQNKVLHTFIFFIKNRSAMHKNCRGILVY